MQYFIIMVIIIVAMIVLSFHLYRTRAYWHYSVDAFQNITLKLEFQKVFISERSWNFKNHHNESYLINLTKYLQYNTVSKIICQA